MPATIEMKKRKYTAPNVSAEELLDLTYFTFLYAIGRQTYATDVAVRAIRKNWESFEKFEKDAFVERITKAVTDGEYGTPMQWVQWKKILLLHKDTTPEMIETLDIIVKRNERNKQ